MNKNSKKVLNDSKAKLDEPATPIPSLLKTQSYEKNRSGPTLYKRILKIIPNTNPTVEKSEKMKNEKNLETRFDSR